jgi:hypothetical protein
VAGREVINRREGDRRREKEILIARGQARGMPEELQSKRNSRAFAGVILNHGS